MGAQRPARRTRYGVRPRLEALEERQLLATFTVTNTTDGASGSLRDAILKANLNSGQDTIKFNIPGTGFQTLSLVTALPAITDSLIIDGTSQPGYSGTPLIVLDGSNAGTGAEGLRIAAGSTSVKALTILGFGSSGIDITVSNAVVQGSFIGTDPSGSTARPNGGDGIVINNASSCQIGGSQVGQGNTVSGNKGNGIHLLGGGTIGTLIEGNFVGVNASGSAAVGNGNDGVNVFAGGANQIGGPNAGEGNVISGNAFNGITIFGGGSAGTTVLGNFIGTDLRGGAAVGNGFEGIGITGAPRTQIGGTGGVNQRNVISANGFDGIQMVGAPDTNIFGNFIGITSSGGALGNLGPGVDINGGDRSQVGGTVTGAGNIIAFNGKTFNNGGVNIFSGNGISVLSNSIFGNFGKGIVHSSFTDFPTLTLAATGAGRTKIQGTLTGAPGTTFLVQFFANPSADPSGFGQGKTFIGQANITTDNSGLGSIDVTLANPVQVGNVITATTTDPANNTSEFSADQAVTKANIADLQVTMSSVPAKKGTVSSDLVYTILVTNNGPDAANAVTLTDTLPATAAYVTSMTDHGSLTQGGNQVLGALGPLAKGETATITITVNPNQIGTITNTVTVSSSDIDPDTSSNAAALNTDVSIPADLGVTITAKPQSSAVPTIGANLVYTITATNHGPGPATGVVLTETLPPSVNVTTSPNAGSGSFTQLGNTFTFNLGTLANGGSAIVTIFVQPTKAITITNTATVTSDQVDPTPGNNSFSLATNILPAADLKVDLIATPEPVLAGQNLTYTATVTNIGPSPATNVMLTAPIPTDATFVSATGTYTLAAGVLTFQLGGIASGSSGQVTYTVTPAGSELLSATATASATEIDPVAGNNTKTVISTVSPADLSVAVMPSPEPVLAGSPLTYQVVVTNNGPADATNVILTDTLPDGLTLSSDPILSQGSLTRNDSGVVVGNLGTLPSGQSASLMLVATPTRSAVLTDTATVSADQIDPTLTNNTGSAVSTVSPADIGVTLDGPAQVLVGDPVVYTATVTNAGPVAATNVTLVFTLPAGAQFASVASTQGNAGQFGGDVIASLGDIAVGSKATVTITLAPTGAGNLVASATVSSDQVDGNPGNNTAGAATSVVNAVGVVQFAQPTFTVKENARTATITVVRSGGRQGSLSVNYAAIAATAIDGFNFRSTSGTLVFANGESTKTFTVPVLDDGQANGDTTVSLLLGGPAGTPLGAQSTATLIIKETDVVLVGPTVQDVQLLGSSRAITGLVVTFSEPLDAARARDVTNYFLAAPVTHRGRKTSGGPVAIGSVTYTAGGKTVLITPAAPLATGVFYELAINGTAPKGLADVFGNLLNSNVLTNTPGSSFVGTFSRGSSLTYGDSGGNAVTLSLTGGGVIDLTRGADGEARILRLIGTVPGRSTLSGKVRRLGAQSTGVTHLATVDGLGAFGAVRSRLSSPPFIVTQQALPPAIHPAAVIGPRLFASRAIGQLR
jgi:uncharacterized repeat protein (TIGR01451 family)